jgi:uncharacterized membrane protein YhaH (DUF805 family)
MNMQEAVRSVLSQYAGFTGRARRSEYWYWTLAYVIVYVVAVILDSIFGSSPLFVIIVVLAAIVPNIAVSVRRLHDTDKSGWFILIGLIPIIGTIILIVFYVMDSGPDNQYGPNPKGASGPAAPPPPAYGTPPTA